MDKIIEYIPNIIGEAARNPFGLFALMVILLSVLGFFFFRKSSERIRAGMFILLFIGVVSFGAVTLRATTEILSAQPSGQGDKGIAMPTIANTESPHPPSTAGEGIETGVSSVPLTGKPFTGAIVTMTDGTIVKLRDDVKEYLYGNVLQTVQGQKISMDKISRFDILDWEAGVGKIKITLTNAEVLTVKAQAYAIIGRNDLGDFSGNFSEIRSVEFIR